MESLHNVDALRAALPRIDLRRYSLEHVCFAAVFEDAEPFMDIIVKDVGDGAPSGSDEERGFGSVVKYRRGSVEYAITETVAIDRVEDGEVAFVRIAYDVNDEDGPYPLGRPPKSLRQEGLVFGRILRNDSTIPFSCHAEFSFPAPDDGPGVPTSLGLPMRPIGDSDEAIYDEIRGVSGVKYGTQDTRRLQYMFSLERAPDRSVSLTLGFGYFATPDIALPRNLIARASELALKFVPVDRRGGRP
jgi:hypothetical protein